MEPDCYLGTGFGKIQVMPYIAFIVKGQGIGKRGESFYIHILASGTDIIGIPFASGGGKCDPHDLLVMGDGLLRLKDNDGIVLSADCQMPVFLMLFKLYGLPVLEEPYAVKFRISVFRIIFKTVCSFGYALNKPLTARNAHIYRLILDVKEVFMV